MRSFLEVTEALKQQIGSGLPGIEAHLTMTPYRKLTKTIPENKREGSVLLLLYEREKVIYFPLILRKPYNGVHSNQISFPGGKIEPHDDSLYHTATRETNEEIGIPQSEINFVGKLTDIYIPPSNFYVYPYVGMINSSVDFLKDEREVEEIIEIPLFSLLNDDLVGETTVELSSKMKLKTPYFNLESRVVWGATAAILAEFKELLKNVFKN